MAHILRCTCEMLILVLQFPLVKTSDCRPIFVQGYWSCLSSWGAAWSLLLLSAQTTHIIISKGLILNENGHAWMLNASAVYHQSVVIT